MKHAPLALLTLSLACSPAPATPTGPASIPAPASAPISDAAVVAELDQVYARFTRAYATLDVAIITDLYTEDALYLPPRGDIRRGRAAIRTGFAGMFERSRARGESLDITFERIDRRISGDLAYEVGYYTLVRTTRDGPANTSRGKFTVVLVRQDDGKWRFKVDGYSAAPVPVEAASPDATLDP